MYYRRRVISKLSEKDTLVPCTCIPIHRIQYVNVVLLSTTGQIAITYLLCNFFSNSTFINYKLYCSFNKKKTVVNIIGNYLINKRAHFLPKVKFSRKVRSSGSLNQRLCLAGHNVPTNDFISHSKFCLPGKIVRPENIISILFRPVELNMIIS